MFRVILLIIIVAGVYFFLKYLNRTKSGNIAAENNTTSAEYWQQSKDALNNDELDKATQLAFQARKKEVESKGYEFAENSSFGNPLHAKNCASEIMKLDIPIKSISQETKRKLRTEVASGALKGENPRDTERKTRAFLEDFEWPEFDQWCNKFTSMNEWPPLWETIAAYFEIQKYSIEELLNELKKEHLLQLSNEYSVTAKKSHKKEIIIKLLVKAIPEEDREKILALVNKIWKPRYLREKRFLLTHTLGFSSAFSNLKKELKSLEALSIKIEYIEIMTADSCSICMEKAKGKIKVATLIESDIPPFHPGCRCIASPVII